MKQRNNKGFSLVEVLIAVAVLALLITPILWQVGKTIEVNKASKERQYAIENADNVLEYIQGVPAADLLNMTIVSGSTESIDGKYDFTSMNKYTDLECHVYCRSIEYNRVYDYLDYINYESLFDPDLENTEYTDHKSGYESYIGIDVSNYSDNSVVKYDATNYVLDSIDLGHDKNNYARDVVVDNLYPQLVANSYMVRTDFNDTAKASFENAGWEFTTEGACVKYDSNDHIIAIVCEKFTNGALLSPNGNGLAYMQDLNKNRVAIIQGNSMNYDAQAQVDLMSKKIERLRRTNYNAWKQYIQTDTSTSVFDTSLYSDNVSKLTKISITSGYDTSTSRKYYDVKCDIIYEDYMTRKVTITEDDPPSDSVPEVLTYNAYTKRFFTNQAPDIYMIYEPYIYTGSMYSANDYIMVYDGVSYSSDEKHSKLYLVKPNVAKASSGGTVYMNGSTPVNVYLSFLSKAEADSNINSNPTQASDANEPMTIFTNMNISDDLSNLSNPIYSQFDFGLTINNNSSHGGVSYGVNYGPNLESYFSEVESSDTTSPDPSSDIISYDDNLRRFNYDSDKIKTLDMDTIVDDRLFTVTVNLTHGSTNIRLTGAKGAD